MKYAVVFTTVNTEFVHINGGGVRLFSSLGAAREYMENAYENVLSTIVKNDRATMDYSPAEGAATIKDHDKMMLYDWYIYAI